MNSFLRHHQPDIAFHYSCFDRILCQAWIQSLQWGGGVVSFFRDHRHIRPITPQLFRGISQDYHRWLGEQAHEAGLAIVEPPRDIRRHDWVQPYYEDAAERGGVAVVLKCHENAQVAVCYPHLGHQIESKWRFVKLYYFYLQDPQLGRFFIRLCPYFPFHIQVCLNGHEWLARQMQREGIRFVQSDNAFVACEAPERLQELADSFATQHITAAVEPWLARWLPFFTPQERAHGYRHQLYLAQVEYCHNLIFHRQARLDRLFSRLLDSNRAIGKPEKLAVIFGRTSFHPDTRTGESQVKYIKQTTPVLRTGFQKTSLKQYVKERVLLRTETTCHQLRDLSVPKHISNLAKVRTVLDRSNDRYLEAQQDILTSYIDRDQLHRLRQPSVSAAGRRTPGLRLDDPRLLAVLQALTCFLHLVGRACFRTGELLDDVRRALDNPEYGLSQLRYDLGKLRGKGLVMRLPGTQSYQLSPEGYRVAVLYQKLYHRLYAPLTAGLLDPQPADNSVLNTRTSRLDRLYAAVDRSLHVLSEFVGLKEVS
jgi:hypothetical protein